MEGNLPILSTQDPITSFIWTEGEKSRGGSLAICIAAHSVINFEGWYFCTFRWTICGSLCSYSGAGGWNLTPSANRLLTCEASPAIMPWDRRFALAAAASGFPEKGTGGRGRRGSLSLFGMCTCFIQNLNGLDVFPLTFILSYFLWPCNGSANPAAREVERHVLMWSLLVLCWAAAPVKSTETPVVAVCPG